MIHCFKFLSKKGNQNEDHRRTAGFAIRADAELLELAGSSNVEDRLKRLVPPDQLLSSEKPVLFESETPRLSAS